MTLSTPLDYQRLFRAQPDALLLLAPDGTVLDNSDAHVVAGLKPREEVVGRHIFEAYPIADQNQGDEIERSHEHVRQHRAAHTMPLIRFDLSHPDGTLEEMYWQATHYPILDESGELLYIMQRTQNVTEQHLASLRQAALEQELQESREFARAVLESMPVLVATTDAHGQHEYFNPRWEEFTGRPQAELANGRWTECVHPDDRAALLRHRDESIDAAGEVQYDFRLRRHDGEYRWLLGRTTPRRGPNGQVKLRVGACLDVHDQKLMVAELLANAEVQARLAEQAYQAHEHVQQQRAAFFDVFTHLPAGVAIMRGPEHRYEFINEAYHRLRPQDPMLGRTVAEVFPEAAEQGFVDLLDQVYRTGEPVGGQRVLWQYDRRGTGQREDTYFTFTYQPLRENGSIVGIHCFALDVTDYLVVTSPESGA